MHSLPQTTQPQPPCSLPGEAHYHCTGCAGDPLAAALPVSRLRRYVDRRGKGWWLCGPCAAPVKCHACGRGVPCGTAQDDGEPGASLLICSDCEAGVLAARTGGWQAPHGPVWAMREAARMLAAALPLHGRETEVEA